MKKALALVVLIVTPYIIFAQGTVVFSNSTSGLVKQWTSLYDSSLTPVPVGGGYVQLITAPKGTFLHPLGYYDGSHGFAPAYSSLAAFFADNPAWSSHQDPVPINVASGLFSGGTVTLSGEAGEAEYVLIGWTGPYTTYDAAYLAGFLGMSAIATTATGDLRLTPPSPPVSLSSTFQGMTLAPWVLPEPSAFEIACLGAVLLFLFRRPIAKV